MHPPVQCVSASSVAKHVAQVVPTLAATDPDIVYTYISEPWSAELWHYPP